MLYYYYYYYYTIYYVLVNQYTDHTRHRRLVLMYVGGDEARLIQGRRQQHRYLYEHVRIDPPMFCVLVNRCGIESADTELLRCVLYYIEYCKYSEQRCTWNFSV